MVNHSVEPLQSLCTVLKTIGSSSEMDKEDATDVALGLAKLMKSEDESSLICFLCKRKCSNRSKFLLHFRSHFSRRKRIADSEEDHSVGTEEDDDQESHPLSHHSNIPPPSRKKNRLKKTSRALKYSDEPESSSSECLGDSESSDSDHDPHKGLKDESSSRGSGVSLKDRLSLAEKQLDNNETEDLICLTCLKRFSNCQNLRRHLRLHISRDSITPDIENEVSSGRYFCDWCPARFDNRSAARVHEDSHKNDQTKCYICDKLYADRYSLRYHLRTHGIGRQIRCEYCNKSFSKPSRLDSHVKSHHNNIRDFKCSVCEKAFKTRLHLTNHFRQHSGERPFACDICHVRFRHKGSLLTHQRSHQGLRPYCCEICGKTFKEPSTLKAHSRVHTGDKPYKCRVCAKTFTQRAGLNYHKRLHSPEDLELLREATASAGSPLTCELCIFSTYCQNTLSSHMQSLHGDQERVSSKLPSFDHLRSTPSSSSVVPSPSNSPSSNLNEGFGNSCNSEEHLLSTPTPSTSPSSNGSASPPTALDQLLPVEDYMQMDLLGGGGYAPAAPSESSSYGAYSASNAGSNATNGSNAEDYSSNPSTIPPPYNTMNYHAEQQQHYSTTAYQQQQQTGNYYEAANNSVYKYYSDQYATLDNNIFYNHHNQLHHQHHQQQQHHLQQHTVPTGYCV